MTTTWLVAKYMEDQRRRETFNVGVVLLTDSHRTYRFLGQRVDGSIDGRSVRWAGSAANFQAWVKYWRHQLESGADIDALLGRHPDDSYFLEFGGERLLGASDLDPDLFADYLFGVLVERTVPQGIGVEQLSDSILEELGVLKEIEKGIHIEVPRGGGRSVDSVRFHYRYTNGRTTLMQRATLIFEDDRSWDVVHSVAWSFERARESVTDLQCVTLFRAGPSDIQLASQLGLLREYAKCIDVGRQDRAVDELREVLHLDGPFAR